MKTVGMEVCKDMIKIRRDENGIGVEHHTYCDICGTEMGGEECCSDNTIIVSPTKAELKHDWCVEMNLEMCAKCGQAMGHYALSLKATYKCKGGT